MNGLSLELLPHPGDTLLELIQSRGMDQKELAIRTGFSQKHISKVIAGEYDITAKFAYALETVFSSPAIFWTNLQANYDLEKMTLMSADTVTDEERDIISDLKEIVSFFVENKLMIQTRDKTQKVLMLRKILGVNSLTTIPALSVRSSFRITNQNAVNTYVLFSWIKICEMSADLPTGTGLNITKLRDSLIDIRHIMFKKSEREIETNLRTLLSGCGIQFRIIRHFKGAPVQGFIEKLDNDEILLCLTPRYSFAGIFWFTLFHEIAHILNGDIRNRYVDYIDIDDDEEMLADEFAKKVLMDSNEWIFFANSNNFELGAIKAFSKRANVLPCIVIERLQRERLINYNMYASEKIRYKWD